MKPSKRKRRIQAIKARLKEYYHLKEKNNYFKRNFIELTRPPEAEYKALETKSPSTIYHLTDVSMWAIGDQEIVTSNMPA